MGILLKHEISPATPIRERGEGQRYEAVLRISEALSACREPEDLTRILSQQLREFLDFFQFYIIVYKENSTEVEWAVVGSEKSLISAYADVPVQERPSWRAYATQEPFHIADWDADERVPARLKQGIEAQGLQIGPLVFVPLTTPHRRLGALGMSGHPGTAYSSEDIGFLRLIGRVVAFAIDDNFNLRQAEAAQRELQRQNERLKRSERELQEVIETIPVMAWSGAADGAADFFNRRWLDYAGLSADQVQGWGWTGAVHPDDLDRLAYYWRGVLTSGQSGEIEARLRRFDGVYRWFLFRATPSIENGSVAKWYGTNTDIEARKSAEQAVAVQNTRLQLLLKLTNRVTSNLELRQVLRAVSANIREVMLCDAVHISIAHSSLGKFRLFALDFPEGKGFVKEELIIEPAGACKRALETLLPAIRNTADPQEFPPDLYKLMVAEGLKTQCVIPLVSRIRQMFTGQERDNESTPTGDFFQARYMSSVSQRFMSPDPYNVGADITNPQSWNGYGYVGGNPLNATDPSGMGVGSFFSGLWNTLFGSTPCPVDFCAGTVAQAPVDTYAWWMSGGWQTIAQITHPTVSGGSAGGSAGHSGGTFRFTPMAQSPAKNEPSRSLNCTAFQAVNAAYGQTTAQTLEYGGFIIKKPDQTYYSSAAFAGSQISMGSNFYTQYNNLVLSFQKGYSVAGWYHDHPLGPPGYDPEHMSDGDRGATNYIGGPGFLLTPTKHFWRVDPRSRPIDLTRTKPCG